MKTICSELTDLLRFREKWDSSHCCIRLVVLCILFENFWKAGPEIFILDEFVYSCGST